MFGKYQFSKSYVGKMVLKILLKNAAKMLHNIKEADLPT